MNFNAAQRDEVASIALLDARDSADAVWACAGEAVTAGWGDFDLRYQLKEYYAAIAEDRFIDLSAALTSRGKVVAVALANDASGTIGYFGRPTFLAVAPGPPVTRERRELQLYDHYAQLADERGLRLEIVVRDRSSAVLGPVGLRTLARGGRCQLEFRAVIDLRQSEVELWHLVRKSFRPMINWGRSNLEITVVDAACPDRSLFDSFEQFHIAVSGRRTRPHASWDEMFRNLAAGRAELVLAHLEGEFCAATFVDTSPQLTMYGSGVYDRARFDKPISHWPMYLSILRARERGCAFYDVGQIFSGEMKDQKLANIGFFKKGFTDRIEVYEIWSCWPKSLGQAKPSGLPE